MTPVQRVEDMLKRVPPKLVTVRGLEAALLALISPESLGMLAASLVVLTVAQAYGVGEVVDAALAGVAYYRAGVAGLWALLDLIAAVRDATAARTDADMERAASMFAGAFVVLGTTILGVALRRSGSGGKREAKKETTKDRLIDQPARRNDAESSQTPSLEETTPPPRSAVVLPEKRQRGNGKTR